MPPRNKGKAKDDSGAKGGKENGGKGSGSGKLKPATSINVRHILCEKHSKKEEAMEKLRNGAKFDEVAREMSEDKARQGGSLGWKTRGSLLAEFEKVAYQLEPSSTGSPKLGECRTGEGYHIIMVEGRK
ncbi:FKBP-like protein [Byssothecium circinans]|uniref:Peptidyl-prolyl cis-trans isomerase n=1 Tax=Byssothecium circinans TaxID=147558 RepID=A0A6A5U0V3_9PLEO|nr:FKBP-like protein [Byssothecium circinans]